MVKKQKENKMKRNEFKLLLEDWKKNFIVESDLPEVSDDELKGDLEGYFDDGSFKGPGLDDLDHPSHMHSPGDEFLDSDMDSADHSFPSEDTIDRDSQQLSYGQYPEDEHLPSAEFDDDFSSVGVDSPDSSTIDDDNIDNLLPEIDEMGDDDYGF